ncbi:MAG: hypothetical protein ABIF82_06380 [Planctomycetota bacterium]
MRIIALLGICLALFSLPSPCGAAEGLDQRETRRKARKEARKARQKVVEVDTIRQMFKDEMKLVPETEGKAGKIVDQKPPPPRLEYNLAVRMRKLFKLAQEKVGKQRDLLAQTMAAEREARAEEAARMREQLLREKRKVDLTVFFDW